MGEIESDKESFYSADSLENLGEKNNCEVKKDSKDLVTVPFYEGDVSVSLNCINNIAKNSIKKKLIKNRTTNSNVSRYSSSFLRLNLQSVRISSDKTEGMVSKCISPSVSSRPLSSSRTNSKIINPTTNIRPRNRSLSYLEQYQKKLSSSCSRNNLYNSTTINRALNVGQQGDYCTPRLNSSNLSEKEVNISVLTEKHSPPSNNVSSKTTKKHQSNNINYSKAIESKNKGMKPDLQDHAFNDKLASLKKRKEYCDAVKKKNQEELSIQKTQSKNKVRGRSNEKITVNNNLSNHKSEKLPLVTNLSLIEKRKAFSENVKQKNKAEFLCQKIEEKTVRKKYSNEHIRANEDCFTQKLKITLNADKPLEKQNVLMKSKKKVEKEKNEEKQKHHNGDIIDLQVLQRRHEQDKIKARNIRNEFLKT